MSISDDSTHHDDSLSEKDRQLFDLLDRYVDALHHSDVNTRSGLLERNPELIDLMRCADSLESLAPSPDPDPTSPSASFQEKDLEPDSGQQGGDMASYQPTLLSSADDVASSTSVRRGSGSAAEDGSKSYSRFGKFELLEEVGRGGMGVVYRARQDDLDRTVALKMILSSRLASEEVVRRFYLEAKAAAGLRHSNIVGVHEVGEVHGQHYFAMDYVDGQSLAEVLGEGSIDAETTAECMVSIARAVHYLHEHNIMHRDLKPSNILIDDDGQPFVTDFGLVKVFNDDSQTTTGTIIGTPSYMAPEQAGANRGGVTFVSDVYSMGAILYEMLTGRPPFQSSNPLETLVAVLESEPTLPSALNRRIPRDMELICMRCLEKDPNRRYQTSAELADDLERFLKREPIMAKPSNLLQKLRRWGRRQPTLVSRLAGLSVAAVIVQTTYFKAGSDLAYHLEVMSIFAVWAVVAVLFQLFLAQERTAYFARFGWAAADVILLTTMLFFVDGPIGPLLIGYPLLVAASGLFFRVRLVMFTTFISLLSYASLVNWRHDKFDPPPQYPYLYAAVLVVLGFIVAHQAYRVRVLSRYYAHRRLP